MMTMMMIIKFVVVDREQQEANKQNKRKKRDLSLIFVNEVVKQANMRLQTYSYILTVRPDLFISILNVKREARVEETAATVK